MDRGGAPQHPMKMGVWRKRADEAVSALKTCRFEGLPDAMNMAWTAIFISTMFAALNRNPLTLIRRKV